MGLNNTCRQTERISGKLLPCCSICGEVPQDGICGVIKLGRKFICGGCEQKILVTDTGSKAYEDLIRLIKKIWK
ncbi:MAG: sigma factor G inhibitor Gin [Syntrophomonadaceae bacterium]|nr:sigma factor G inhibitor Gin [Syntrophomonadaceae bacterium]MDD3023208.1 sigma factor G inhibitor Gin [Syntrophomonadaceae bacterium]